MIRMEMAPTDYVSVHVLAFRVLYPLQNLLHWIKSRTLGLADMGCGGCGVSSLSLTSLLA